MAEAGSPSNQISYDDVCKFVGKLFLEQNYEIERLTNMLLQMQQKLGNENQEKSRLESALKEANQKISVLETIKRTE